MPDTAVAPSRILNSILMLLVALLLFASLDATGKYLAGEHPIPMLVWARYLIQFILMLLVVGPHMGMRLILTQRPRLQIVRAFCLLGVTVCLMAAFKRMPLAETTAILFIAPLLVTLAAGPVLGEQVSLRRWGAVIIGFAGVLLIVRPGSTLPLDGVLLAFIGAALYAAYQVLTRHLASTEHPVTMLFYVATVGTLVMTLALPWYLDTSMPGAWDGTLILTLGIYGTLGHFLLTKAYHQAPASTLAPVLYAQLGWAALIGWLVFGDLPDGWSLGGIVLIAAAGILIALEHHNASRHDA